MLSTPSTTACGAAAAGGGLVVSQCVRDGVWSSSSFLFGPSVGAVPCKKSRWLDTRGAAGQFRRTPSAQFSCNIRVSQFSCNGRLVCAVSPHTHTLTHGLRTSPNACTDTNTPAPTLPLASRRHLAKTIHHRTLSTVCRRRSYPAAIRATHEAANSSKGGGCLDELEHGRCSFLFQFLVLSLQLSFPAPLQLYPNLHTATAVSSQQPPQQQSAVNSQQSAVSSQRNSSQQSAVTKV